MLGWYAAKTKPASEFVAEDNLKRQGFNPLNPKYRETSVRRGARVTLERPYFTGYIFVRIDVGIMRWQRINATRGVKQLIMADEVPIRIRDDAMALVKGFCDSDDFVPAYEVDRTLVKMFQLKDLVKVSDQSSPFLGFMGPVEWVQKQRVKVLLNIFGQNTRVEVDASSLESV